MGESLPETSDDALATAPYATALLERWVSENDGALMVAILELSLESLRSPELVTAVREWRGELVDVVEGIVSRSTSDNARLRAETAVASIEGIVLSALALPSDERGAYIAETLRTVLQGTSPAFGGRASGDS